MNRAVTRPVLVFAAVSVIIGVIHVAGRLIPGVAALEGTLIGAVFIIAALYAAKWDRLSVSGPRFHPLPCTRPG